LRHISGHISGGGHGKGKGGDCISGGGRHDDGVAELQAHIVHSEAARKRIMRKWTNVSASPPPKLAPYAVYAMGEAFSSRRRPCSLTPPSSSNDDEDDADSGCVIGPEDFVKEPTEEERALAEALAKMAEEEAQSLAALRVVEAF
jgi:hypothetical protein